MSTISAGTTSGTALVNTGDTTGSLILQTNGTTTAVTIGTNQVVTLAQALPVGSGGTGITTTPTAGTVPYGNGTTLAYTAAGSSGQVLTSAGASAPTWSTPSTGALTLISSQTVSTAVANVDFTSGITSTYDDYLIIYGNVLCSSNNSEVAVNLYKSGAFQTSGYMFQYSDSRDLTIVTTNGSVSATRVQFNSGNTTANVTRQSGRVMLSSVNTATAYAAQVYGNIMGTGGLSEKNYASFGGGAQSTAAVVTGIRFYWGSGGNFTSGTFRLYGVAK